MFREIYLEDRNLQLNEAVLVGPIGKCPLMHDPKHPLLSWSGIKESPFLRSLKSVPSSDLLEVSFRWCITGVLNFFVLVIIVEPLRSRRLLLHLLPFLPLFLAKELLGFQHHPSIEVLYHWSQAALSGPLIAGEPRFSLTFWKSSPAE